MSEIEELLKRVEELHLNMIKIKEGKSVKDREVIIESRILDIVLSNFQDVLIRKLKGSSGDEIVEYALDKE
ncbi:MAG: aspartyl-phosphate phosphatase Spo0E family protein [Bacillota bacterium]|nr:aspartyl-phosphate phosphatase Spo0E family protein [Bacillota bacterium]MDP4159512.1 aspartyl-phosphate phosphatase Spo0E family protein [Bacillota bacterium]